MVFVWVQLPDLPVHLFNFESLAHVCAPVGKLLILDAPTVKRIRRSVARARIVVDLRQKRIDKI